MLVQDEARPTDDELVAAIEAAHARVGRAERELLRLIAQMGERDLWQDWGARDFPHWLSMRLGISGWKARRMIAAADALEDLPVVAEALESGRSSLDKVVELTRFATPETEERLVAWAETVTSPAIRQRADTQIQRSSEDVSADARARWVEFWFAGGRFGLRADLPAAQGAIVARALDRAAGQIPQMPGEQDPSYLKERRADALVELCSARPGGADPGPDRASVIVHARLDQLESGAGGCEVEGGAAIDPRTVRRLLCDARVQTVVEDPAGDVLGVSPMRREPPVWMVRQLRYRDTQCRFPGCGATRFTQAHHVKFWRHGGKTELANLLLVCWFHHRLVHEHGWKVTRSREGEVRWFRPSGVEYRAGPSP